MKLLTDKEVEILEEQVTVEVSNEVTTIWPEHYESYIGDGIYLDDIF